ncbi:MAG: urease accessory protein UreD [Proteobacteria bacterium]|nr:urease accessory protein UreD [Pseudomonadota bacterium]
MYDAAYRSDAAPLQRATGGLALRFRRRDRRVALADLWQSGCLKARFPRSFDPHRAEAVQLNVGGGVAAGDRLDVAIAVEDGASVTFAAQAAERFYRALPGAAPAVVRNAVSVADGASLEWLPQETILFDRAALDRRLDVTLDAGARFLGLESLVFGRAAMGETVERASLRDLIRIRRAGRLVLHDAVRLEGEVAAALARPAIANGARAVATLVQVAPEAEAMAAPLRAALADAPAECGVSAWDGMLLSRIVAPDGAALRASVVTALAVLRDGRALPRVWMC